MSYGNRKYHARVAQQAQIKKNGPMDIFYMLVALAFLAGILSAASQVFIA